MRIILFLLVTTIFMSNSCRKTSLGEYYFRCKVDGQEYIPNSCANCMVGKLLGDTTFLLNGNRGFESILIGVIKFDKIPISTTTYVLDQRPEQKGSYKNSTTTNDKFDTDSIRLGQLQIITLDKTNNIIAGNFYFQGYNPIQNKIINITGGEFRLKYTTN